MKKLTLFMAIVIALTSSLEAKWKELKPLSAYDASNYKLKVGVEYLELRQYETKDSGEFRDKPYRVIHSFYRKNLDRFSEKTVKKFKNLKPIKRLGSNIKISKQEDFGEGCNYMYNAFLVDSSNKMWRMNNLEDVLAYLGDIDTPAELQTLMLLKNKPYALKYRKVSKGYEIMYHKGSILGEDEFCKATVHVLTVDKSGKIVKDKFIKTITTNSGTVINFVSAPNL